MNAFTIQCPTAIQFGLGASERVASLLDPDGTAIAFLRGSSSRASAPVAEALVKSQMQIVDIRVAGEPSLTSVNTAFRACREKQISMVIACGGGSVIDTGKALAVCLERNAELPERFADIDARALQGRNAIQLVAIPTTAGTGAEVTANAVLTLGEAKTSLRGPALFPDVALVDPGLLMSAPPQVVLYSGLDAVVQTIEAYTSRLATPFSDALTAPNVSRGLTALRRVVEHPDADAWSTLAWVSLSSGMALANGGLGAAHGLAATLGAALDAPHGALCGRLIAPVLEQNRARAVENADASERIAHCIRAVQAVFPPKAGGADLSGLEAWAADKGLPRLRDFGADPAHFTELAERSVTASSSTKNAVALTRSDFEEILQSAF